VQNVLYVYAVTRDAPIPDVDGVDASRRFGVATIDGISAVFTPVSAEEFSQDVIDRRAGDLEWLGAIGYRHQNVVADLMKQTAIVPLRAFTLFSSEESVRSYLHANHELLSKVLQRLDGKQEWTLRIELDPEKWHEALPRRVAALRELQSEIGSAAPGKAFLLKKKLQDETKRASHAAEQELVAELERVILEKLGCETVSETRERRDGAFPQINVLINRDEESVLQELHGTLGEKYAQEGVILGLTGPWPPYSFAQTSDEG
jgi:hypothetical protein